MWRTCNLHWARPQVADWRVPIALPAGWRVGGKVFTSYPIFLPPVDQQDKKCNEQNKWKCNIPDGTPVKVLDNPSSNEAGPMDSGEGHLLHDLNPVV